jgi:hypothetical protein
MEEAGYNDPSRDYGIYNREWMKENIIGTNNNHYFLVWCNPEYSYFKLGYEIYDDVYDGEE